MSNPRHRGRYHHRPGDEVRTQQTNADARRPDNQSHAAPANDESSAAAVTNGAIAP